MLEKDKRLIEKIIYYCEKIGEISNNHGNSIDEYMKNDEMQLSMDMCIFQIGELSNHITEDVKKNNPSIPWSDIKGLRNIQAHEYENKDYKIMWKTIETDVPDLKEKLKTIIANN